MVSKCNECGCGKSAGCAPDELVFNASERVPYSPNSVVSSAVVDGDAGTLTLFSFDQGQCLSTHSAPFDAIVHVIEGEAQITVGNDVHSVAAGEILVMPADVPHSVEAIARFKMVLTMFKA